MVCTYQITWEKDRPFLKPVPSDRNSAFCKFCNKTFSIKEGLAAVRKHESGKGHLEKGEKDVNANTKISQVLIEQSFKQAEVNAVNARKVKDKALEAEAILVASLANHGIAESFFDCLNILLPKIFPDSAIIKEMNLGRTKAGYLLTSGVAPHMKDIIHEGMRKFPFSLNFDESTVCKSQQLNINVSFRNIENNISKANFTTIEVLQDTKGESIANMVLETLDEHMIPLQNLVSVQTDGCAAMLGRYKGTQTILRQKVPHLPDFGGCEGHDACNILKNGVKKMMPDLIELFSLVWANLEKHSMKKSREYQALCEELGQTFHHIPKFLEVRFRYVLKLAKFMEENDRGLYVYYSNLAASQKLGSAVSDTESKIISIYINNYIVIRLLNRFVISVGQAFVDFIDFFEAREIRVQFRFEKMLLLLHSHLSKFLHNGGVEDEDQATVSALLNVDPEEKSERLSRRDVVIGRGARDLIEEMGLTHASPELNDFFDKVFLFYESSSKVMIKYFRPGLSNKLLRYLSILKPTEKNAILLDSRKKWLFLAYKFPNILSPPEVEDLREELVSYKHLDEPDDLRLLSVDEWFGKIAQIKEAGIPRFPLLSKLALGLATIYNSSSEAERDFSKQNVITDGRENIGQEKLQAYLTVMSHHALLGKDCQRCKESKETWLKKRETGKGSLNFIF